MDRPAQVIEVDDKAWTERAKARMAELGVTQAQLAAGVGALPARIGHYLQGRRDPSLAKFMLIARYLQVTTDWLLFGGAAPPLRQVTLGNTLADQIQRLDPASQRDIEGYVRIKLAASGRE